MELNHCTESDIDETVARELDRAFMDTDGIEPHLVEARLDESAKRRHDLKQREQLENERHRPIRELAAKMLREQLPQRVSRGFVDLTLNDDTPQVHSDSDADDPESLETQRLLGELEAEIAASSARVAIIDQPAVAASTSFSAQPKPPLTLAVPEVAENLSTAASATHYPTLPMDTAEASHAQLVTRSIELASQYRKNKSYWAVRDEFIHVSLALNQYGLLAPVFRDQPRIPFLKKDRDASHDQLLIDQIVIDCHWLHSRGERVSPVWPELKQMFDLSGVFDCVAIAASIAVKGWSSDFRADELFSLAPRQQVQLMQLRSNARKERYRALLEGKGAFNRDTRTATRVKSLFSPVRSAIYQWGDNNHRVRGQEEMYEALWLARELLDDKASSADLAELAALRCGVKPLKPKTVSGKMTTLDTTLIRAGLVAGRSAGV